MRRALVLLFDLDGVLVDSRRPIALSINFAMERLGLQPFDEDWLHRFIGAPLRSVFVELLEARDADASQAEACIEAYRTCYGEVALTETRLVAGIDSALEKLETLGPLAVVTSKPVEFARPILERVRIGSHFRSILGPPLDAHESKAQTLARALASLRVDVAATRTLLVGDTRFDMEAARSHDVLAIGVTWGIGTAEELRNAGAHCVVHTPEELVTWVQRL